MKNFFKRLFNTDSTEDKIKTESNSKRRELTEKFFRNLQLIEKFKISYESYCDKTKSWNSPAFGDSNITNRQYYITLKQVSDEEYSENQCQAIYS